MNTLQLWGGIECTVNRVGDAWFDQLSRSGHAHRPRDLDLIAGLGIRTLRYPVLWERSAPRSLHEIDWGWADERLRLLGELGIAPIVGLVHHGSGPGYTNLLDESFATGLAEYAGKVATRYPWIDAYTPVNEPLTTARFSGLYGLWYPHRRDARSFVRALVVQCRAIVLAMRAIRRVNPAARLVQPDDFGTTYGTSHMRYQVDFDNERRWLAWDLLCGKVSNEHPLRQFLMEAGASATELDWFPDNPCPPDVVGLNHYLTSDRYLDERLEHYPQRTWGANSYEQYADVEAVRIAGSATTDWASLLRLAAARYGISVAITEAHLGCTREEQLRWLREAWNGAQRAKALGVDVAAVTAWSLLGSYDWNTLLTGNTDHYEPGAFDVRGASPRPTALAGLISDLCNARKPAHPAIRSAGWWRRHDRILFPDAARKNNRHRPHVVRRRALRPILITGGAGTLGQAFAQLCERRGLNYRRCERGHLDICSARELDDVLDDAKPWCVINAAGYVRVDDAEVERERCTRENITGPRQLAIQASERDLPLLTFSTDLVFDGNSTAPYVESSPVAPLNVYGETKARAESDVLELHSHALVVRTSSFFGPWDRSNFLTVALHELATRGRFVAAADVTISPTYVPDLVNACLDLLIDGERGIWHVVNADSVSWAEFARRGARSGGFDPACIEPRSIDEMALRARRPRFSALTSERAMLLGSLDEALGRYFRDVRDRG